MTCLQNLLLKRSRRLILFLAVVLRFVLLFFHWPADNADEAIMGLMARSCGV